MSQDQDQDLEIRKKQGEGGPSKGAEVGRKVITLTLGGDRVFRLHKERVVLGTLVSADVRLLGEGISPIHAVVELSGSADGAATIYDLASETGVFVNGEKAITRALKPGDQIVIGRHSLQFGVEDLARIAADRRQAPAMRDSGGRKLFLNPGEDLKSLLLEDERVVEEIFDYAPTTQLALQVVMSWRGTVLDVRHFVKESVVTIGNARKNHFGIPTVLSSSVFPFVTRAGEGFTLHLEQSMQGLVQRKGELTTLDQIRRSFVQGPDGCQVPLNKGDFGKIGMGEVDFYLSFTPAPPRLRPRKLFERDPFFLKIFGSSMLLTALVVMGLLNARVTPTLEAEQLPERIATILYQPEKYAIPMKLPVPKKLEAAQPQSQPQPPEAKQAPEPQKTAKIDLAPNPANTAKPIPTEMNVGNKTAKNKGKTSGAKAGGKNAQNQAKEGQGARAKGKEGTRGQKNAKPGKEHQDKASRPSPQGGTGAGSGSSQVPDEGNVDLLKGASEKVQNLLGNSAAQLGKGGEKLKGFGGFTTQGEGGLALAGSGKGGGGDAASLGGLSDKGRGGGRVGTGMGAAGNGSGIVGGSARVVIRSGGPEEAVVMGSIDADAVEAALLAHRDEFRLCYEKEINAENPDLAGRVGTSFVIGSSGRVGQAGIESTTLKNANAERCILNVIKRIQFPIPRGAGVVQVSYPFKFSPVRTR